MYPCRTFGWVTQGAQISTIPVAATVGRAYSFVFGNLGLIYRLCWFPILLSLLPGLLSLAGSDEPEAAAAMSIGQMVVGFAVAIVIFLIATYFTAMALVAVHRLVLFGDRQPGRLFVFSAGPAEFYFTLVPLAVYAAMVALILAVLGTGLAGRAPAAPPSGWIVLAILGAAVLAVWVSCRLVALYPLIVMTERIPLREAWRLSRGSFWRINGVYLLAALPAIVVGLLLQVLVRTIVGVSPEEAGVGAGPSLALATLLGLAIGFLVNIPLLAVGVALLCYGTKALAGLAPDEVVRAPG